MGYAVVGYFDNESDKKIKTLWKGMADIGVCDYLFHSANNPHIKFVMVNELDVDAIEKKLNLLAQKTNKINVHFKTYSFYPNESPFLCIDIAVSIPILELQSEIKINTVNNVINDDSGFFQQGIWKPDCQLTRGFDKSRLNDAINYLSLTDLPFDGILERIGLIEFHPAKQLFSYELL